MIAIVDYQMGNLRSVQKALQRVGHQASIVSKPDELESAEKIVLPGVGAFADAIAELRRRDLVEPLRKGIEQGKPFLGICLGLQLLFEVSYEDGRHQGLGVLPGEVRRFQLPRGYKVPHMGWNQVRVRRRAPMLTEYPVQENTVPGETAQSPFDGAYFYFVHSYYAVPQDPSMIALETDYHHPFCSMVWRDNVLATQFHPEKSQSVGLKLLKNFAELSTPVSSP